MISACMTVSVRELRTAVREWACCDRSPGSQYNVWRYINLWCSKAGNSELETVTRN